MLIENISRVSLLNDNLNTIYSCSSILMVIIIDYCIMIQLKWLIYENWCCLYMKLS